jgi:hypothetical protein
VQWRDQMRDKFGLDFRIVDSELMRTLRRERGIHANPWVMGKAGCRSGPPSCRFTRRKPDRLSLARRTPPELACVWPADGIIRAVP